MKIACFIPIKQYSERVAGKNFRMLNGKKLYEYIIQHAIDANCFDEIYIDTNSDEIKKYANKYNLISIDRPEHLASNIANGNDLLMNNFRQYPDYDYYFQLFATSPFLQPESIKKCVEELVNNTNYDSIFTATEHKGFFWYKDRPITYEPAILPRSQDLTPIIEETTGLYGISRASIQECNCRIGKRPYIYIVNKYEAVDINTEEDFMLAEYIGSNLWKNK